MPMDARTFMLERSGFVDFYQLLGVRGAPGPGVVDTKQLTPAGYRAAGRTDTLLCSAVSAGQQPLPLEGAGPLGRHLCPRVQRCRL